MTPFELALESDLRTEERRFANEWLFRWHGLTYQGGMVDVDRFDGGRICMGGGVKFGDQQQRIFWGAIGAYLDQKIHEFFKRWESESRSYPPRVRMTSIDGVEHHLKRFAAQTIANATETDRSLRGAGYPQTLAPFGANGIQARADYEIIRLG